MTYENANQFIRDWLAALRGGKYAQGKGWLRSEYGYCCLGVACDIWDSNRWLDLDGRCDAYASPEDDADQTLALPADIIKLLGLTPDETDDDTHNEIPVPRAIAERHVTNNVMAEVENTISPDSGSVTLSTLNDKGATFDEIANVIEEWWFNQQESAS